MKAAEGAVDNEPDIKTDNGSEDDGIYKPRLDPRIQRIIDHLWGPTGSIILHILIVILLINLVLVPERLQQAEIEVTVVDPEESKLEEFEKQLEEMKDIDIEIDAPDVDMQVDQPPEMDTPTTQPQDDLSALDIMADAQSPLVLKGLYGSRTAAGRKAALSKHAAKLGPQTEEAVIRALEWLKNSQLQDGAWSGKSSSSNKPAMTGLALLCFLAHGETQRSERYGATVDRAIRYLLGVQKPDGSFDNNSYANGIASYALSEAYALTRIPGIRSSMESGVAHIMKGMQDTGGFTYGYAQNGRRDTSVAGWQAQAMKAAFIAGADVPGLKEAMELCAKGIKLNYVPESGRFRYAPEPGKTASGTPLAVTAIGTLCLQLLGHANSVEVEGGLTSMDGYKVNYADPEGTKRPLYSWYYMAQTFFHKGGAMWNRWNNGFAPEMLRAQQPDGSWTGTGEEEGNGPVYGTTFAALTMMVYYRYLPTYQPIATEIRPTEKTKDDVVVEVI